MYLNLTLNQNDIYCNFYFIIILILFLKNNRVGILQNSLSRTFIKNIIFNTYTTQIIFNYLLMIVTFLTAKFRCYSTI